MPVGEQFAEFASPLFLRKIWVGEEAKGRVYPQDELARSFSQALFPRMTNRHGCVTLHSYHFYLEEGLPHTQVLLWVCGEQLGAAFDTKSWWIMGVCQNDSPSHHISRVMTWGAAIARPRTRSRAATGRWSGIWPKARPQARWQRLQGTASQGSAPWSSATTSRALWGWAIGGGATRAAWACDRQINARLWPGPSTSRPRTVGAGPAPQWRPGWRRP
jgi:hypothetical protein